MKVLVLLVFSFFSFAAFSQEDSVRLIPRYQQKGFLQGDFLSIKMPNGEKNIGLTGIHYNLNINKTFYAGIGYYGSITGLRGGFFTLGVNAGLQQKLTKNLFVDASAYFGGGGGADAPDGGGAVVMSRLNLGYKFPKFELAAGYSYVNFFDGGFNQKQSAELCCPYSVPAKVRAFCRNRKKDCL